VDLEMSIRKGSWGQWEVVDENERVVAVVDSSEEAVEVMIKLSQQSESQEDDGLFGIF
jgi:hypothetical protein